MYSLWVKIVKICFLHMAVKSNVLKLVFSYIYQNTEKCIRPPVFYTKLKNIHSFNLRGYRSCWLSDHQNWVIENILVDGSQILTHKRRRQQRINDSCMTGVSTCWCFTEFALKWWTIYHAIKLQLFQCSDTNCVICAWWMTHDTGSAIYRQNVCGCNQTQVTPKLRKCCKAWYYPVMATKSEVISQTHLDSVIYKVKGQLWGFPSNRQTYPRIQGSVWQKKGQIRQNKTVSLHSLILHFSVGPLCDWTKGTKTNRWKFKPRGNRCLQQVHAAGINISPPPAPLQILHMSHLLHNTMEVTTGAWTLNLTVHR